MHPSFLAVLTFPLLFSACTHSSRSADRPSDPPMAPLTDLQGRPQSLHQLVSQKDATLLVFFSTTCPCVRRYQERVEALPQRYPEAQFYYVSSNADDDLEALTRAHRDRRLSIPLLVDWSGSLAKELGARSTPTVVLLDRSGQVRFLGWIDNERLPGESGRIAYVDTALEGLLSKSAAFESRSPTYGCTITRSFLGQRTAPSPDAGAFCH